MGRAKKTISTLCINMNHFEFHHIFILLYTVPLNGACYSNQGNRPENKLCFEELGCFSNDAPWTSFPGRPSYFLPLPLDPRAINTKIYYFSRKINHPVEIQLWPKISLSSTDFRHERERTVFITHGFTEDGLDEWLIEMKDAILKRMDANVFLVDWQHGAKLINYFQATANTRMVGAEIGRFLTHLVFFKQQKPSKIYLIGHSLGAQIMSYAANFLPPNAGKVGRITGLDPAQPCFEMEDNIVKLDSTDADFVDIVHTSAAPTIPFLGLGIMEPIGHVDFYVNGGFGQPHCAIKPLLPRLPNLTAVGMLAVELIKKNLGCSHDKAKYYFTSALNYTDCGFTGRKISNAERYTLELSLGVESIITRLILRPCYENEPCTMMGLETENIPVRGMFVPIAKPQPPYCDSSAHFKKMKRILLGT